MAVSFIRTTESHAGTTGSVSEGSYSFAVGIAGDAPKGIVVFTMQGVTATEKALSVAYGGSALTAVPSGSASDTSTEPGRVTAWFLGTSVPSGAQNAVVTRTSDTTPCYAVAFLLGGSNDLQNYGTPVLQQENAAMVAQTINPGTATSIVLAGGYSGDNTPAPTGSTGTTSGPTLEGTYAYSFGAGYETTPTTGSRSRGLAASNDDCAQVVLAITESVPITGTAAFTAKRATFAATGTYTPLAITGTVALTLKRATFAATGTQAFTGTVAFTAKRATFAATAAEAFTGTVALALKKASLAATGTAAVGITGTVALTLKRATFAATAHCASFASLLPDLEPGTHYYVRSYATSAAGTGYGDELEFDTLLPITGTVAFTLKKTSLAATATYTPLAITGTVGLTLKRATFAATGTYTPLAITGTVAFTLKRATFAATAAEAFAGTAALTVKRTTFAATGTYVPLAIAGTAALTVKRTTFAATGTYTPLATTGTAALTVSHATLAVAGYRGAEPITGTVALTFAHLRIAAKCLQALMSTPDVDFVLHLEPSAWAARVVDVAPAWTAELVAPDWNIELPTRYWTAKTESAAWSGTVRKDH